MSNELRPDSKAQVKAACKQFFDSLEQADLQDHPQVFEILDDYAREHKYMISCEQRGIFGVILKFQWIREGELP